MGLSIIAKKAAKKKAAKMATEKKAKQNEISRIQNKKQISESELRRVSSLRKQIKSLDEKIKKGKLSAASVPKSPKVIRNAEAGGPSYPKKKSSTPTQRAFGGGKRKGLSTGRKQGAAAGAAVGLSVSAILAMRSKSKLEELKKQKLNAEQRAAVNKALRQVAEKEAAKAKMGGTKPKPRDLKRGGAVKKFAKGGSSEGAKIQKAMEEYKKEMLIKLQKEHGKKDGLSLFLEMEEMGYFNKGGAVKKKK